MRKDTSFQDFPTTTREQLSTHFRALGDLLLSKQCQLKRMCQRNFLFGRCRGLCFEQGFTWKIIGRCRFRPPVTL